MDGEGDASVVLVGHTCPDASMSANLRALGLQLGFFIQVTTTMVWETV